LVLSDDEFWAISRLVREKAGINLHGGKKELVRARLAKQIRDGDYDNFDQYYRHVLADRTGDELVRLLDAVATNLTQFFREPQHFRFMDEVFLPELEKRRGARRLRVWSAGCSTGEEPYSAAITVLERDPGWASRDFKVLATDLSTKVLAEGRRGVYPADRLANVRVDVLKRHFRKGRGDWEGYYMVNDRLRKLVAFRRLNLIEPFPFQRPLDLIFCRNVMIYFDKPTQEELVGRLHEALAGGGYLFIGHSESLNAVKHHFKYIQPTVYQKPNAK
jgi:chemotaxis protein methyltransferase CheR